MDRVTEILDVHKEQGLIDWYIKKGKRDCNRVSNIAKKLGTKVHQYIEDDLTGLKPKSAKSSEFEYSSCIEAWKKFRERHEVKVVSLEEELVNEEAQVIGHRDFKGFVDGRLVTLDYKTSTMLSLKNWIQVNTYNWLANYDCEYVALLRLDKNIGTFDYQVYPRDKELVSLFFDMLRVKRGFYDANGIYKGGTNGAEFEESSNPTKGTISS